MSEPYPFKNKKTSLNDIEFEDAEVISITDEGIKFKDIKKVISNMIRNNIEKET